MNPHPSASDSIVIRISLPFPPSIWEMYEGWGDKRHLSPAYAKWRDDAGHFIKGRHKNPLAVPFTCAIALRRRADRGGTVPFINVARRALNLLSLRVLPTFSPLFVFG